MNSAPAMRRRLDARDLKILAVLEADGRITNQRLAELVHLSPSACLERLRRLEAEGLISGYHARLALDRLAPSLTVFVEITVKGHEAADFERFEQAVRAAPEIVECHAIGGGMDYIAKFITADIRHYQAVMESLLARDIGIGKY